MQYNRKGMQVEAICFGGIHLRCLCIKLRSIRRICECNEATRQSPINLKNKVDKHEFLSDLVAKYKP